MKNKVKKFNTIISFVWIGFVSAISFMEAWLKFQAPGVTTKLGLGIGQIVFGTLNKVEITFAMFMLLGLVVLKFIKNKLYAVPFFLIPLAVLTLQTLWLLPALHHRANLIIQGITVPKSSLHVWYVILEIIKVMSLFTYGIKLLNIKINENR